MKHRWTTPELLEYWSLTPSELTLVGSISKAYNKLGMAVLLKYYQYSGRFPDRKSDIPQAVISHTAKQLKVAVKVFAFYKLQGRTSKNQRTKIRRHLNFRIVTATDIKRVMTWLDQRLPLEESRLRELRKLADDKFKELKVEPPSSQRLERIIRSQLRSRDEKVYQRVLKSLSVETRQKLDNLFEIIPVEPGSEGTSSSLLQELRTDVGSANVFNAQSELRRLQIISAIQLPSNLFSGLSSRLTNTYRKRIIVTDLSHIRQQPPRIKYTLLAAYCYLREQEIKDNLAKLLIKFAHKIDKNAEKRIEKKYLEDFRRVQGKQQMLFELAQASLAAPEGTVKDVIYPVVSEQTLTDLVKEYKASTQYETQVRLFMRGSYSRNYRKVIPDILNALEICSNRANTDPLIEALHLIKKYFNTSRAYYPEDEYVPFEEIVPNNYEAFVREGGRVNRISYELCALKTLSSRLRCRDVWIVGADRYRNPDKDLPDNFDSKRQEYYSALNQPVSVNDFIASEKQALTEALKMFNRKVTHLKNVAITTKNQKPWIKYTDLEALPEPQNLASLKAEVGRIWTQTSLLDVLKEADLRLGFTNLFKSAGTHEKIPREEMQKRLILCLFGIGTNTGLKRVASEDLGINYRELLYTKRRFVRSDSLRAAIAEVANAVLRERDSSVWGEATTACASDSKKYAAYDQNLLTEWHIRYRGPGVMVYWHIEKKSLCIYSQLKSCSSSEVAAMIEGVLRHCTDMEIEKNYVDTHGQSVIAFAFCHLLGFQLRPRFKNLGSKKLYVPDKGQLQKYPNLKTIISRPINWYLIEKYYDEMIKYSTALRLNTAETEAILSRFATRSRVQHPLYQSLVELGRVRITVFLCHFLSDQRIQREAQEALNVVENWNGATGFIHYGRGGEIATNKAEDQEIGILSLHLLQICLVYINTLMVQRVFRLDKSWHNQFEDEDYRGLTPMFYSHINPYGEFRLDMDERINLA